MGKHAPCLPLKQPNKGKIKVKVQRLKGKKGTMYSYRRVSTPTNKKKAGNKRHREATQVEAERRLLTIGKSIEDVINGSLPAEQRKTFVGLMQDAQNDGISEVLVESARDVARDSFESEVLYRKSTQLGVQITPADMPYLFVHNPTPVLEASKFITATPKPTRISPMSGTHQN